MRVYVIYILHFAFLLPPNFFYNTTPKDGMRKKDVNGSANWGNTRRLAACFDPLDGSGNADAAICTGTVVS